MRANITYSTDVNHMGLLVANSGSADRHCSHDTWNRHHKTSKALHTNVSHGHARIHTVIASSHPQRMASTVMFVVAYQERRRLPRHEAS
nr:hypothetical protein CFP56_72053 [Quercus suber]